MRFVVDLLVSLHEEIARLNLEGIADVSVRLGPACLATQRPRAFRPVGFHRRPRALANVVQARPVLGVQIITILCRVYQEVDWAALQPSHELDWATLGPLIVD